MTKFVLNPSDIHAGNFENIKFISFEMNLVDFPGNHYLPTRKDALK